MPDSIKETLTKRDFEVIELKWPDAALSRSPHPMCVWVKPGDLDDMFRERLICWAPGPILLTLSNDDPAFVQAAWRYFPADVIIPAEHGAIADRVERHGDFVCSNLDGWRQQALPLAHAGVWIYSIQRDTMRSNGLWRLLDEPEERNGASLEDWLSHVVNDQQATVRRQFVAMRNGDADREDIEFRMQTVSGRVIWLRSRIEVEKNASGRPLALKGVTLDVTEYKTAEELLHENQTRYRHLFQTLRSGVCVIEAADDTPRFVIRDCNRAAARLHRRSPESLTGVVLCAGATEITDEGLLEACREVWRSNMPQRYEYRLKIQNHLYQDIEHYIYKLPTGAIVIVYDDVTQQKQAENNLEQQLHFVQEMIDSIPNPVFYKDIQRLYRFCNKAFEAHIGLDREQILGHGIFDLLPPDAATFFYDMNSKVFEKGEINRFERSRILDGQEQLLLFHEAPYINKQGQMMGLVGSIIDITDRKRMETLKLEKEKLAERGLRLASLGTLAGGLAHEINQPLTVIKAEVDGVRIRRELHQIVPEEELLETMEVIGDEVARIHEIIDHMRSLIRGRPGDGEKQVDLNEVVRHGLRIVSQQVSNHGVALGLELADDLPPLRGYPINLEQIVINLVVNAMQALDSVQQQHKEILVRTRLDGGLLALEVEDNGPGIPQRNLPQVFDPFFTTKYDQKGLGLGLAIVENYAQLMNGQVSAENLPDGGAVFRVSLPVFVDQ